MSNYLRDDIDGAVIV